MKTLGELFDELTELARVTSIVHETQSSISRGGDPQSIDRRQHDYFKARDQMDNLRARALDVETTNNKQRSLFGL
jgi:hypothetical protein